MKKIFRGKVEKGKVVLDEQEKYNLLVWSLNGKDVELTIWRPENKRSNQQNRYYRGVVIPILCESTGYDENEMHDALRMLFLRDDSGKIPTLRSTTELTTVTWEEYMSKVRIWASAELQTYIPEPREMEV